MYNLRYHIASLVGVFLAMSLGLILGGLVVQRGTVDRQQGALVEGLRKEFTTLRTENRTLTEENGVLTSFSEEMSRAWVADRLGGKNVVVVSTAGRSDGARAAADAIRSAGGAVIAVTLVKPGFGLDDAELRASVTSLPDSPELVSSVAASLVAEWKQPSSERPITQKLQKAGVLEIEGLDADTAAMGLVDVAARSGKPDADGLALAMAFARKDGVAVAGEVPRSKAGLAPVAWARKVPSLDSLGTEAGRYTLVALMTGAEPGYYGVGETAAAPYPDLPKE